MMISSSSDDDELELFQLDSISCVIGNTKSDISVVAPAIIGCG